MRHAMSWTDKQLDFQEKWLREEMASLHSSIDSAEHSIALTLEVDAMDTTDRDPTLPLKATHFSEYLQKLRDSLDQLQSIQRTRDPPKRVQTDAFLS